MQVDKQKSILLSWNYEDIKQECEDLAAMYTNLREDKEYSQILLSKHDDDFFNVMTEKAINEIYQLLSKHRVSIDSSLFYRNSDDSLGFEIIRYSNDNGDLLCSSTVVDAIEYICHSLLIDTILLVWAENNALKDVYVKLKDQIVASIDNLRNYFFLLKHTRYSKTYTTIIN